MSLASNSIDVHEFISLKGTILTPAQQKVVDSRPGVDSHEFILQGLKGQPFTLTSEVDCEDYADAKYWLTVYKQLIDGGAVEVIQGGSSGDDLGYRVVVLSVDGTPMALAGSVGQGFSVAGQGYLVAQWNLIAVPFTAP